MEGKVFTLIDEGTNIVVLAVPLHSKMKIETTLLEREGLGEGSPYSLQLTELGSGRTERDSFKWDNRTLLQGHRYIQQFFETLLSGAMIDLRTNEEKRAM